jgi:hypothetical protein
VIFGDQLLSQNNRETTVAPDLQRPIHIIHMWKLIDYEIRIHPSFDLILSPDFLVI